MSQPAATLLNGGQFRLSRRVGEILRLNCSIAAAAAESSLLLFATGSTVLEIAARVALVELLARRIAHGLEQNDHYKRAEDAHAQNANHSEIAVAELMGPLLGIFGPASVQRIGGRDTTEIAETRDESRRGGNTDLTVTALKDFRTPGHADGHGRAKTKPNHQEATVAGPTMGESSYQQASNLDTDSSREKVRAELVEAVRDWGNNKDSNQVHLHFVSINPILSVLQAKLTIQMGAKSKLISMPPASGRIAAMMTEP